MSKEERYVPFELPSHGLLYENGLHEVNIRPMFTTEEKYLAGARRDWQAVVDKILSKVGCVKDLGDMEPQQLLSSDRLFLLFAVRKLSYGEDYSFGLTCDNCGTHFTHTMKIFDDIEITEMKEDSEEPFFKSLKEINKKVGFRLLRGADEKAIDKYVKRELQRKSDPIDDPGYLYRMARHIVSVDGNEVDLREALHLVEEFSAMDSTDFRDAVDDANGGVDLELQVVCRNCDTYLDEVMPFTRDFFRPRRQRR